MNEQKAPGGIEWTRVWGRRGFTWNPTGGCMHGCRWTMPSGKLAVCYAETTANKFDHAYQQGFEHHYWRPGELSAPTKLKEPAGIFVGSMADVFGHWVPEDQIRLILDTCRVAHWHTFQFLTKNPARVKQFDIPRNCWIGASVPPDVMWGKVLTEDQKRRMFERTLKEWAAWHGKALTWLSLEPLSWDADEVLQDYIGVVDWIVIGAASDGPRYFQPKPEWVSNILSRADRHGVPVFFKGNLTYRPYRGDFPAAWAVTVEPQTAPEQMRLF